MIKGNASVYYRERYIKNREKIRKVQKKYYDSHKYIWEKQKVNREKRLKGIREKMIRILGGVCVTCGFKDQRALQVDHINGGGSKERTSITNSYKKLLKDIEDNFEKYQLLCANCNWIKRYENKEYR